LALLFDGNYSQSSRLRRFLLLSRMTSLDIRQRLAAGDLTDACTRHQTSLNIISRLVGIDRDNA
jgi:hypothetical protein